MDDVGIYVPYFLKNQTLLWVICISVKFTDMFTTMKEIDGASMAGCSVRRTRQVQVLLWPLAGFVLGHP